MDVIEQYRDRDWFPKLNARETMLRDTVIRVADRATKAEAELESLRRQLQGAVADRVALVTALEGARNTLRKYGFDTAANACNAALTNDSAEPESHKEHWWVCWISGHANSYGECVVCKKALSR